MLKADKIELRAEMRNGTNKSNERLAELYDCSIPTVRKYRRLFHPQYKERANGR